MAIDRTLVQIRERSTVDLLDLALVVVRRRAGTLALAGLAGIGPIAALNAWLFSLDPELPAFFPATAWMVEAPFATAPLTVVMGGMMFGQRPTAGRVASALFRASLPLVVIQFFLRLVLLLGLSPRLAFGNEILLLERGRWWKILGRGGDLSSGRAGTLFVLGLFQVVFTYLFALLFFVGTTVLGEALVAKELTWDLPEASVFGGWHFQLPIWLVTGFFAVVRFLAYIDQRIRLEGWEVELRLRSVAETMQEARRW